MKKGLIPILMVSLLLISDVTFAQMLPAQDRNLILTEGNAEVMGQNDSAKISIAVVTEGRDLEQASLENSDKTKSVLKAVNALNIKHLKFRTSNYRVTPKKDFKARPPRIKGYEVYNAIEVTLEGFVTEYLSRNVSQIIGKALENGSNNITQIQFYISDRAPLEKEALKQATQEAIDRAKVLAEAAGVKLKRITSLSTHPVQTPPRPYMLRAAEMKTQSEVLAPPIEVGESRIRVRVSLSYEIE